MVRRLSKRKKAPADFFFALGENILSNTLLYLADRYIAQESWALISPDSIGENLTIPWEWDRDEYFTNEPPQGKPCGIFSVALYHYGGSFDRKFIIPSGLIPHFVCYAW
jgi:hypothetical protein